MECRFSSLIVDQFPCLSDNYGFLLHDTRTGLTATVDTPQHTAITERLTERGWSLDIILNTHWHFDHTGGNLALKKHFGCEIIGPEAEGDRIPGRDRAIKDGDRLTFGESPVEVIGTPGHTKGHVIFYFPEEGIAFVGDTLFSLGCGRLFEGDPAQMWQSLSRLRALPEDTVLFCAHEYSAANARFALSLGLDNSALTARAAAIFAARDRDEPTVPIKLGDEKAANPFLRADDPALAAASSTGAS